MSQIKLTLTESELRALPEAHNSAARVIAALREWANDPKLFQPKEHGGTREGAGRKPAKKQPTKKKRK